MAAWCGGRAIVRLAALICLSVATGACGGAPVVLTPAEEEFVKGYTDAMCGNTAVCCPLFGYPAATEARCRRDARAELLRARRAHFSPQRAALCVEAINASYQTCTFATFDVLEACFDVWNSGQPPGSPCDFRADCAAPGDHLAWCEDSACVEIVPAGEGEPCDDPTVPVSTLERQWCDEHQGLICNRIAGVCQRAALVDEPCANVPCAPELACRSSTRTCIPRGALGATCGGVTRQAEPCLDGLYCTGTCEARVPPGGSCAAGQSCLEGDECDGTTCHGVRMPGQACDPLTDLCTFGACVGGHCTFDRTYFTGCR